MNYILKVSIILYILYTISIDNACSSKLVSKDTQDHWKNEIKKNPSLLIPPIKKSKNKVALAMICRNEAVNFQSNNIY
jgi:hypothetical protein